MASILIVDDDAFFRQLLRNVLSDAGYEIIEARSASEGESMLSYYPDLVIVDYRMPGMDGVAWIKRLREYGNTIPIVFCSGSGCDQQKFSLIRNLLNVSLIVQKPIKPAELLAQIEKLLPLRSPETCEAEVVPECVEAVAEQELLFYDESEVETAQTGAPEQASFDTEPTDDFLSETDSIQSELMSLAAEYIKELPNLLQQIKLDILKALAGYDPELAMPAAEEAHRIRGTSGSLGLSTLSAVTGEIEKLVLFAVTDTERDNAAEWESLLSKSMALADEATKIVDDYSKLDPELSMKTNETQTLESGNSFSDKLYLETPEPPIQEHLSEQPLPPCGPDSNLSLPQLASLEQPLRNEQARRLLIVTQDKGLSHKLEESLSGEPFYCVFSETRDSAIFELARMKPDIALLDEQTAFIGEENLGSFIRRNVGQDIVLLVLLNDLDYRITAIESGFDDFILLPLIREELLWRLHIQGKKATNRTLTVQSNILS